MTLKCYKNKNKGAKRRDSFAGDASTNTDSVFIIVQDTHNHGCHYLHQPRGTSSVRASGQKVKVTVQTSDRLTPLALKVIRCNGAQLDSRWMILMPFVFF